MMHLPPEIPGNVCNLHTGVDTTGTEGIHRVPTGSTSTRMGTYTAILAAQGREAPETEQETAYPRESVITAAHYQRESGKYSVPPTVGNTVAKNERENFIRSLPERVQVKLDQKFGKDRIAQNLNRKRVCAMF